MTLSPTRQLHHKVITSLRVIANLPDTERQAEKGKQKKYAPNERAKEILRKKNPQRDSHNSEIKKQSQIKEPEESPKKKSYMKWR